MSLLLALTSTGGPAPITGTLSITFNGMTVSGDNDLLINGVLNQSFSGMTLSGTGDLDIVGQSSITFAGQTFSGVGDLDITGALSVTFGSMTASADSDLIIQGTESGQMGDMTLASIGQLNITGSMNTVLEGMSLVSTGELIAVTPVRRAGGTTYIRHKSKHKYGRITVREIKQKYQEIIENAPDELIDDVLEVVSQFAEVEQPKVNQIDWNEIVRDLAEIQRIIDIYQRMKEIEEDDEDIVMLMYG